MDELIVKLHSIGAIKFGSFGPKKELLSPFHIDLSGVVSHPQIAREVCTALAEKAKNLSFDLLSGVPPVASHLASYIAWDNDLPFIALKSEGASKVVGSYRSGQRCLLLNDLLLNNAAAVDVAADLQDEGLEVQDILSFFDMGIGGKQKVKGRGYVSHSVIGIADALQILFDSGKMPGESFKLATDFLENG